MQDDPQSPDPGGDHDAEQVGGAWTESVLYRFTGGTDGFVPLGVVFGRGGALYGTTRSGDTAPACFGVGCGTVFSVLP